MKENKEYKENEINLEDTENTQNKENEKLIGCPQCGNVNAKVSGAEPSKNIFNLIVSCCAFVVSIFTIVNFIIDGINMLYANIFLSAFNLPTEYINRVNLKFLIDENFLISVIVLLIVIVESLFMNFLDEKLNKKLKSNILNLKSCGIVVAVNFIFILFAFLYFLVWKNNLVCNIKIILGFAFLSLISSILLTCFVFSAKLVIFSSYYPIKSNTKEKLGKYDLENNHDVEGVKENTCKEENSVNNITIEEQKEIPNKNEGRKKILTDEDSKKRDYRFFLMAAVACICCIIISYFAFEDIVESVVDMEREYFTIEDSDHVVVAYLDDQYVICDYTIENNILYIDISNHKVIDRNDIVLEHNIFQNVIMNK